jgi:hypothetical protein
MHGGELLCHDRPHGRHGCLRSWAVLGGFCSCVHELSYGSVSSIRRFDELQQLSHRHLSGIHRLDFVGQLHGMHGGELLRHDRSHGRHCCLRYGDLLYRCFDGLFKLRNRYLFFVIRRFRLHQLFRRILPRQHRPNQLHDLCFRHVFGTRRDSVLKLRCGDL